LYASTLERLAAITALGGAVLTTGPAAANAASTCTFDPSAFPLPAVDVFDDGGLSALRITRSHQFIAIVDGHGLKLCPGSGGNATVLNTDRVIVHGAPSMAEGFLGGFVVDEANGRLSPDNTLESDGIDEIETCFAVTTASPPAPHVVASISERHPRVL
jgi:hypothetical protein